MYTIFNDDVIVNRGSTTLPAVDYLRSSLDEDFKQYLNFYRPASHAVPSNHLLVRLLQSITVPVETSIYSFVGKVQDVALDLAQLLKLTSMQSSGQTFRNVFYPSNIEEVIIANIDDFDIIHAEANWMELEPIKVLTHPITSIDFPELWGTEEPSVGGVAVISINIPMLAFQFRQFALAERAMGIEVPHTLMQFLTAYPLANAVKRHVAIGYFNILQDYYVNGTMDNILFRRRFAKIDRSELVYKTISLVYKTISHHTYDTDTFVTSLLLPFGFSLYDVMQLPDILFTRQDIWALVTARCHYVNFILVYDNEFGLQGIQPLKNKIKISLRAYESDRGLVGSISDDLKRYLESEIENGIKAYI